MLGRNNKIVSNETTYKKYIINPKITIMKQSYIKSMSDSELNSNLYRNKWIWD